jgi:hypothetical protein
VYSFLRYRNVRAWKYVVKLARHITHPTLIPTPDYTLAVWGKSKHVDITEVSSENSMS